MEQTSFPSATDDCRVFYDKNAHEWIMQGTDKAFDMTAVGRWFKFNFESKKPEEKAVIDNCLIPGALQGRNAAAYEDSVIRLQTMVKKYLLDK